MGILYRNVVSTPEEAGYDASRLPLVEDFMKNLVDKGRLQASGFLLSSENKNFAHAVMGCYINDKPIQPDIIFPIASTTKMFTGVAILKLVEDGKIRLDQMVADILLEFKKEPYNTITIEQLLSHTSGLLPDSGCFQDPYNIDTWSIIHEKSEC